MAKNESNFLSDLLLGGISASLTKTIIAPIERVQVLLQTQDSHPLIQSGKVVKYTGISNCMLRVSKEEGFLAFWRGNFSNVMRYFPAQAFNFAFKDYFRMIFCPYDSKLNPWKFFFGGLLSGGLAGALSLILVYPLDFIRTRLAADILNSSKDPTTKKRQFKGSLDCVVKIYRAEGVKGIYSGVALSAVMYFFYRAIYFGGYDTIKHLYRLDDKKHSISIRIAVALLVTNSAGFLVFPLDTVRRRLMMQAGRATRSYDNGRDCIRKIWRQEGGRAFYKGGLSNVFRGSGSAFVLVVYDEARKNWKGYPQHFPMGSSPDPMIIEIEPEDLFFTAMNPNPPSQGNAIGMTPAMEIQAIENLKLYVDQGLSTASSIVSSEETGKSSEEEIKSNNSMPREAPKKKKKKKTNRTNNVPRKIMIKRPQEHETPNTGCRCKRSKCKKNYCECMDQGVACGEACGCVGCGNREGREIEKKQKGDLLFKKVKVE